MMKRLTAVTAALLLSACDGSDSGSKLPVSVAFSSPPPTTLASTSTASLSAVVANDPNSSGVKWSVSCSAAPCGAFSPDTTGSGVQTTYTPPASVSATETVTLTATSVADSSKTASTTVTLTPPPSVLADGKYVYHFAGQNEDGAFSVAGAFTVDDGRITDGEQDYSDANGVATDTLVPATSNISIADDKNVQIVLDTGDDDIGDDGVITLRGSVVSPTRVLISQFNDDSGAGAGSIDAQDDDDAAEQPDGSYAFVVSGQDSAANRTAIGGVLSFDDGDLSVGDSVFDVNQLGVGAAQAQTFDSGSVSAPDDFGRVTITLQPSAASNIQAFKLTGYIVDDNKIQLVESQQDDLGAALGGTALGQGDSAGGFDDADVADTTYVHGSFGTDANGPVTLAGALTFNADGTVGGQLTVNDITVHATTAITAGTWVLDPTGRVTVTGVNNTYDFELYLDGNGNGLVMSVDTADSTAGLAFQQTVSSTDIAEATYAIAAQGVTSDDDVPSWAAVGQAKLDDGDIAGFTDITPQGDDPKPNVPLSGSVDSQNAVLSLAGLNLASLDDVEDFTYYPIDENRTLAIESAGQQAGLLWLEAMSSDNSGGGGDDDD